jgi:cytochrome c553
MKSRAVLRLLSLLVAGAALAGTACIDENILDPMADRQPKENRYKESEFFSDGLSMLAPPEGTVPRERITQNPVLTTGRLPDGPVQPNGEPLPRYTATIPVPVTRKLLDLGRKRFDITCATCHGPLGDGDSIVARQMSLRPPPSLLQQKYIERPSGYFFEVATKGFGMMASYAGELTIEERWAVAAYIRALQLSQTTPAAALPPDVRQRLDAQPAESPAPTPGPRGTRPSGEEHP